VPDHDPDGLVEVIKKLVANFEKDEDGYWTVVVQLGPKESVISNGQTLPKARKRVREALAVHFDIKV
jgi:predicted RNase H-like HicB family nuclease